MTNTLDDILLSDNVVEEFYAQYNNNIDFKKWLLGALPEVEDCKNLKQDNPWHIYNCLDHILHSVEQINIQTKGMDETTRKRLAYTMFLHDIGKPECVSRRYSKLYKREIDSFFNHNKASVQVANRVLPQLGFDKDEQDKINLLVHEHDIFMFITLKEDYNKYHKVLTRELIDEYIDKYNQVGDGAELLEQLIMVGKADNMAQNPEMTASSLKLLDNMEQMLNKNKSKTMDNSKR